MIENIVIFLLGAIAASLVALFIAPMVTRRAARLAERRIRASAPLSMTEIQAQKDLLRADFAVQIRKVELRLEKAERQAAERQITLGRREETLREREIELADRKAHVRELEGEVEGLRATVFGLEKRSTEQAAALKEKQQAISVANDQLRNRTAELEEAQALTDTQKVEIVALKTQIENLHDRVEDLRAELAVKSVESEEHAAEADELKDEVRAWERVVAERDARIDRRRELLARRRRQVGELRAEIANSRTEIAARTLTVENAKAETSARDERIAALEKERSENSRTMADLQARLDLRDRELVRLQKQISAFRQASHVGTAADSDAVQLRESINDLAARIVNRAASAGDDEIRKLIETASGSRKAAAARPKEPGSGDHVSLVERIKEVDLHPGE